MDEITSERAAIVEQPAEPRQPQPWYRRRNPLIAAGAVILAAGVGLAVGLSGGGSPVTVRGSISLGELTYLDMAPGATVTDPTVGDACQGADGYTDIAQGATVTIGGSTGQSVAVAALSAGKVNASGSCEFDFTASVPDQGSYTVTIGHRGTTTWTKAQAMSAAGMTLSLTYAG
jgi:hypothetical protein